MTVVATHFTRADAELSQLVLWAAGIPYEIEADGAFASARPGVVRVLVEDSDAVDAWSVLDWPAGKEPS
jgi:hypothetical protein